MSYIYDMQIDVCARIIYKYVSARQEINIIYIVHYVYQLSVCTYDYYKLYKCV